MAELAALDSSHITNLISLRVFRVLRCSVQVRVVTCCCRDSVVKRNHQQWEQLQLLSVWPMMTKTVFGLSFYCILTFVLIC